MRVYEQGSGRILQSASAWDPSVLLQAIGYEYTELDDSISVIFYEAGTYTTSLTVQVGNLTYEIPFTVVISDAPVTRLVLRLPAALTAIDDEAFTRTAVQIVDLRGTQVTSIGAGAFSACTELLEIHIPASVTSIADSAFSGSFGFTICCPHGSTAETFALAHEVAVRYE